mmetsp:Transcript_8393/g.16392  ORF Transcript_8393/g.16392 Transcript_8393/m.16392 type:complete len:457 (+) Transcript_8393:44-1414(+)
MFARAADCSWKRVTYFATAVVIVTIFLSAGSDKGSPSLIAKAGLVKRGQQTLQAEAEHPESSMVKKSSKEVVLVTGGLGFIGSHVVEEFLERGLKVVILDDESNGHNHNNRAKEVSGDITVVSDLSKLDKVGVDYIVHLAAAISVAESMKKPEKYERINIDGSRKVLEWAKKNKVKNVVAASSAAVYGNPDKDKLPLKESEPYAGLSPYAKSKWDMEGIMSEFWTKHKLPSTALRFFNVYGPRQDPANPYSGVISLFMQQGADSKDVKILGDGMQTRDFVYVKDVAKAIAKALLRPSPKGHGAYNVCTGHTITINELAKTVIKLWGSETTSKVVHGEARDGDIKHSACRPDNAEKEIGFKATMKVEEGLGKTLDWFKEKSNSKGGKFDAKKLPKEDTGETKKDVKEKKEDKEEDKKEGKKEDKEGGNVEQKQGKGDKEEPKEEKNDKKKGDDKKEE